MDLFSGLSDVFSETLPISGMTRSGRLFLRPQSEPRTGGNESSSLPGRLFRTPCAAEAEGGPRNPNRPGATMRLSDQVREETEAGHLLPTPCASPSGNTPKEHLRKKPGRERVTDLSILVENDLLATGGKLLPTPSTIDGKPVDVKNQVATRNSPGLQCMPALLGMPEEVWPDTDMTGNADRQVGEAERRRSLLPTPRASDGEKGGPNQRGSKGDLTISSAVHLLPTPRASDPATTSSHASPGFTKPLGQVARESCAGTFGPYAEAIERWERVLGRPAPAPTELTPKGKHRLSARFVEWLMGQADGWVTDPDLRLSRVQQLRALGNGVVSQQAVYAITWLLERAEHDTRGKRAA